ncbi:MAG: aminotransferase class V-fold PLP-dependent enzyme [Coriobacteriia bacterium]|nr:aminotransferase class V-fold PLP-dependent enzyme [Coriobacteriia bacterium]
MAATTVYLDHAASSWPKPPEVVEAVVSALTRYGGNPGRGAYRLAMASSRLIFEARRDLAALLHVPDPRDLLFTSGATEAANLMLKGVLHRGDRVVTTSMEHNAVSRPLNRLTSAGVEVVVVTAETDGTVDADAVEAAVRAAPTRAVACTHASNLTGSIQPVGDLADVAHAAGALMFVDGAQAAGHLPVDVAALGADAYAVSGHKGLLGPQGIGALYLAPHVDAEELLQGGTGAGRSEEPVQPLVRPERYEAGTPNTPGIAGLGAAARLLAERGEAQRAEERRLLRRLHEGLLGIGGFRVLGPGPDEPRVPVLAVTHERVDADQLAFALDRRYGIATRAGLHCSPWAHETLGTLATGALRFGLGWGNTEAHVDLALEALSELTR